MTLTNLTALSDHCSIHFNFFLVLGCPQTLTVDQGPKNKPLTGKNLVETSGRAYAEVGVYEASSAYSGYLFVIWKTGTTQLVTSVNSEFSCPAKSAFM